MTDRNPLTSVPLVPHQTNSERVSAYQLHSHQIRRGLGLGLEFVGDLLVIVALFEPWLKVFGVPGLPFPTRSYSPWMALQRGHGDALGVATGIFFVLTLGLVLATLVQAFTACRARAIRSQCHRRSRGAREPVHDGLCPCWDPHGPRPGLPVLPLRDRLRRRACGRRVRDRACRRRHMRALSLIRLRAARRITQPSSARLDNV